jgi:hypothetical protein
MASEPIPKHPVAPRLASGHKVPHIGPDISAYKFHHAQTVGHESDAWWAKVRCCYCYYQRLIIPLDGENNPSLGSSFSNSEVW